MLKKIAVAVVAAGGLMAATAPAHAGGHVSLSIGIPLGVAAYGVAPAYPAYAPAYYGPPAYAAPAYYGPPAVVYAPPRYYPPRRHYHPQRYYAPPVVYRAPVVYGNATRAGWYDRNGRWHY